MKKIFDGLDAVAGGACACSDNFFFGAINNYGVIVGWNRDEDGKPYVTIESAVPVVVVKPRK